MKMTKAKEKIKKTMTEYGKGELHSGSKKGPVVKKHSQAIAIALDVARRKGMNIPVKKTSK